MTDDIAAIRAELRTLLAAEPRKATEDGYVNISWDDWRERIEREAADALPALIAALDAAEAREARLRAEIDRVLPEGRDPANDEQVVISGYDFWAIRAALGQSHE